MIIPQKKLKTSLFRELFVHLKQFCNTPAFKFHHTNQLVRNLDIRHEHPELIDNIESGKANPSFENACKIATALGIHPADLFLRNASSTVRNTKSILKTKLLPQIEDFIEKEL